MSPQVRSETWACRGFGITGKAAAAAMRTTALIFATWSCMHVSWHSGSKRLTEATREAQAAGSVMALGLQTGTRRRGKSTHAADCRRTVTISGRWSCTAMRVSKIVSNNGLTDPGPPAQIA
jgi:hypothetical protein